MYILRHSPLDFRTFWYEEKTSGIFCSAVFLCATFVTGHILLAVYSWRLTRTVSTLCSSAGYLAMLCSQKRTRLTFFRRADYNLYSKAKYGCGDWEWLTQDIREDPARIQKKLRLRLGQDWLDENILEYTGSPPHDEFYLTTKTFAWSVSLKEIINKRVHCSPELEDINKMTRFKLFLHPTDTCFFCKDCCKGIITLKCLEGILDRHYLWCITIRTQNKNYYCIDEKNNILKHNFSREGVTSEPTPKIDFGLLLNQKAWICVELW